MKNIRLTTRIYYNFSRLLEHFSGIKLDDTKLKAKILKELKAQGPGKVLTIDTLTEITPQEFKQKYLRKKKPLVLKGMAKTWECHQWNLEFFKKFYGDDYISAMSAEPKRKNQNISYQVSQIKLRDYIEQIENGLSKFYVRFNNFLYTKKELSKQINLKYLSRFKSSLVPFGHILQLFLGPKNSKTNLHAANLHNLFIQMHGKKRWILYPCHYDPMLNPPIKREPYVFSNINPLENQPKYPIKEYLDFYDVTLEPGDILYLPSSMWHYVENLETSIGAAYKWFDPLSASMNNFTQNLLLTFSTSPSLFYTFIHRKNLTRLFDFIDKKENGKTSKRLNSKN